MRARGILLHCMSVTASSFQAAWEPLRDERSRCATQGSPTVFADCVRQHWQRCINGSSAGSSSDCWSDEARAARPKWLQIMRPATASPCRRDADWVWATVLCGNAINYTNMALVQAFSVRLFSCYRHVTLVTPDVSHAVRALLGGVSEVREVPRISWPNQPAGLIDGYRWVFSKLNIFRPGAVGHEIVAFLDADIFLLSPAADQLFEVDCAEVTRPLQRDGRVDICTSVDMVSRLVQSGVVLARPSEERFAALMRQLSAFNSSRNAELADVAFFTHVLRMHEHMAPTARRNRTRLLRRSGVHLFNLDSRATRFPSPHDPCPHIAKYAHWSHTAPARAHMRDRALRGQIDSMDLWHHCGPFKLDRLPTCLHEDGRWAEWPTPFCNFRVLRLYQFLAAQSNPCAALGASARHCAAHASVCQWCGLDVRCVPREWSCWLEDPSTAALASRLRAGFTHDHVRPGWCSGTCDPECCSAKKQKRKKKPPARAVRSLDQK